MFIIESILGISSPDSARDSLARHWCGIIESNDDDGALDLVQSLSITRGDGEERFTSVRPYVSILGCKSTDGRAFSSASRVDDALDLAAGRHE